MVADQVDATPQELLQILGCLNVLEHLGRHCDEEIHIAALMVLTPGHRTEKAHARNAELLEKLGTVLTDEVDVFLRGLHVTTI